MALDYTSLLKKLTPDRDGEPHTHLRTGVVAAINSDGTLDITMSSGVLVPDVPKLAGAYAPVGAAVQMISFRGVLLVIGATSDNTSSGPMYRANTTIRTSVSSSVTTTETTIDSVTAPLVSGRTYRVTWDLPLTVSVATDTHFVRIRENNSTGTQLNVRRYMGPATTQSFPFRIEAEYTAVATANKTFVGTFIRSAGTGSLTSHSAADVPSYLYVDYVRG